jgi:hypothetical protein
VTHAELIRDSLLEIAAIDPIDPTPPDLQTLGLTRYNSILNQRNAARMSVYATLFPTFTTTSGLSPHTIGLTANSPTWTVTGNRPVDIDGANMQQGSGVSLLNIGPLVKRDRAWWLANALPQLQSGIPTDFYYEPTWPNGSVYLWPVPNAAITMQLELRVVLLEVAEADITNDFSLPPGYQRDLTLTLAEDLCGPLSVPMPAHLPIKAREARAIVQGNNNPPLRIATWDFGMPGAPSGNDGYGFNYLTGKGAGR